jgi:hypothetical protein
MESWTQVILILLIFGFPGYYGIVVISSNSTLVVKEVNPDNAKNPQPGQLS